jgi:hypothetical protein
MAGTDWGVLSALRGRTDWNTIRGDKQRDLQYQAVINHMQEQKNAEQMQKQQAINEYMQTAGNLNVLPKGMERIRAIDDELRQPIIEKIKKYGGDLDKYWKVEGQSDMQNYLNNLLHHPTTVKEIMNASNFSRWQADKQAGMQELTDIDSATGKPVNFFEEQVHKYNLGDTDELNYKGGYKAGKTDETIFGKLYGDQDRYKAVPVGAVDFYDTKFRELMDAGLSEPAAKHQASLMTSSYKENYLNKGKPLYYKSDKRPVATSSQRTTAFEMGERAKADDAKYVIEQLGAALTGKDDVYRTVSGVKEVVKDGKKVQENGSWKRGSALSGVPVGQFTYETPVVGEQGTKVEKQDNFIQDWMYIDGQPLVKTTESEFRKGGKVNGVPVDRFGYMKVTDDLLSGIARANKIPYHTLRESLKSLGAYGSKTPEAEKAVTNEAADGYEIGQILNGYKYLGGDPADESNWEQE